MSLFTNYTCYAQKELKRSLKSVLNWYGFASEEQQNAFKLICEKAGIDLPTDLGTEDLLKLVDTTQKNLVNRVDKQERWEISELDWMNEGGSKLIEKFKKLGFVEAILPSQKRYDIVCILGARMNSMADRIKFVEFLIKKGYEFNKVALLTGERYIIPGVDCSDEKLSEIAQYFDVPKEKVTEAQIFRYLYDKSSLNGNFELIVIDTPQEDGRRATTQTTVEDFCEWHATHKEVKNAVFISEQPHVLYQKAIIEEVIYKNKSDLCFEVIGQESGFGAVKSFAGALGSYIWANMPNCLRNFGFKINSDKNLLQAKSLYYRVPWFYNSLPIENY